jgi:hypothetical protein
MLLQCARYSLSRMRRHLPILAAVAFTLLVGVGIYSNTVAVQQATERINQARIEIIRVESLAYRLAHLVTYHRPNLPDPDLRGSSDAAVRHRHYAEHMHCVTGEVSRRDSRGFVRSPVLR